MSEPYYHAREVDFLKSLPLPKSGYLLHINCGEGGALAQFHDISPDLNLEGIEPSDVLRTAFGERSDHGFSACVWREEYQMDSEIYDVICLSGKKADDVRELPLLKKHLARYWPLMVEGGFLIVEVSLADDHGTPSFDWEANRVPWLEKNLQQTGVGGMIISWLPVPSKERGILALQKGGSR